MERLTFDRWTLHVDREQTVRAYALLATGSAATCDCAECRNWLNERLNVLPASFITLLNDLGVDPAKETEVSEYEGGTVTPDRNLYWGEYLFIGSIEAGPDCYMRQPDGKGVDIKLEPLVGDFLVGFSSDGRWAAPSPAFIREKCSVVVFQVHARRGEPYA